MNMTQREWSTVVQASQTWCSVFHNTSKKRVFLKVEVRGFILIGRIVERVLRKQVKEGDRPGVIMAFEHNHWTFAWPS